MIITCEECSTRFTLDDSMVKPEGSKVRCSRCRYIFTAFPELPNALEPELSESSTLDPDLDIDGDIEFDEPDFSISDDTGDISFDAPDTDGDLEINFSEAETSDFDDQDIDFDGIDFEEIEFEEEGDDDFSNTDFTEPDFSDTPAPGIELEMESDPELPIPDLTEDVPSLDMETELEPETDLPGPLLDFEDTDLQLGDDDLNLESQDLDFEDIQLLEDDDDTQPGALENDEDDFEIPNLLTDEDEDEDIGISFNPKRDDLDGEFMPLDSEDDEGELESLEFETEDDVDLELVFDDDPDADLILEEDLEEPSLELEDAFDDPSELTAEEDLGAELELEEEPDFLLEANLSDEFKDSDGEKFTDYDAVLDQDPEVALDQDDDDESEPEPDFEIQEEHDTSEKIPDQDDNGLIEMPSAAAARKKRAKKKKGSVGAPVKILLLLFLLVIAAYIASIKLGADIPYLSNINIPFVTDALKPAAKPQPVLKPVPNEASINGRFVSNSTAGELFIVTGRIENPSTISYSHIKVKGTLLTKDKAKAGTQLAYCGNIISEETLKKGDISEITKQLTVKEGLKNTNVNIKPGGSVLFMLVFSTLPENLTNFTVEVANFKAEVEKKQK